MSIVGMTDRAAALPIVGTLRKGDKRPNENKPGADLTYFRFVCEDALALSMFHEAYPDEDALRNIHVFFPYRTAAENFDAWIEKWVAGGLIYRSDGVTQVLWRTEAGGYSTEPRPDPSRVEGRDGKKLVVVDETGKRSDGSMQVGRLSVIIPELGRLVTVTVMTTSKHDIMRLSEQLAAYEALRGDLRGIPFIIRRRLCKVSTPAGNGKRVRRDKWLLSIETQPQWTMLQLAAMERAALPEVVEGEYEPVTPQLLSGLVSPINGDNGDGEIQPADHFKPVEPPAPPAPEPPRSNGNGNGDIPTSPEALLALVNARVTATYDNVNHLYQAVKHDVPGWAGWPVVKNKAAWQECYDLAMAHAKAKEQPVAPEAPAEPEQDELPF